MSSIRRPQLRHAMGALSLLWLSPSFAVAAGPGAAAPPHVEVTEKDRAEAENAKRLILAQLQESGKEDWQKEILARFGPGAHFSWEPRTVRAQRIYAGPYCRARYCTSKLGERRQPIYLLRIAVKQADLDVGSYYVALVLSPTDPSLYYFPLSEWALAHDSTPNGMLERLCRLESIAPNLARMGPRLPPPSAGPPGPPVPGTGPVYPKVAEQYGAYVAILCRYDGNAQSFTFTYHTQEGDGTSTLEPRSGGASRRKEPAPLSGAPSLAREGS